MNRITIIGTGKVGSAFAIELHEKGYHITGLSDINYKRIKEIGKKVGCRNLSIRPSNKLIENSDMIIISVNDDNLLKTVKNISKLIINKKHPVIVHTSGIYSSLVFERAFFSAKRIASIHPVQTFESVTLKNKNYLKGIYFDLEGGSEAILALKKLISKLESEAIIISAKKKTEFHLCCVMASNFLNANYAVIERIGRRLGIGKETIIRALSELTENTLQNIIEKGAGKSLTGPIERGDRKTLIEHIKLLYGKYPEFLEYYIKGSEILTGIKNMKSKYK